MLYVDPLGNKTNLNTLNSSYTYTNKINNFRKKLHFKNASIKIKYINTNL